MGGAYTLFHVALEVEPWRQSIVEILCAHIQCTTQRQEEYQERYAEVPSIEIQLLMRLLFTKSTPDEEQRLTKLWMNLKADLSGSYLCGIDLQEPKFQGANLLNAQFQGCVSDEHTQWRDNFNEQIRSQVNKDAELSGAIFAGGLPQEDLDKMIEEWGHTEGMIRERLDAFRSVVAEHVGKPKRRGTDGIPEKFRDEIKIGAYTKAEAERWIESYEESVGTPVSPDEA